MSISQQSCLAQLRIVIVEDETMIAMLMDDVLSDAGATIVGRAGTVASAMALIERERPDAVTLDGNLHGELSGPVATHCEALGVRYMIVTGYVEQTLTEPRLAAAPRLVKPFTAKGLIAAAETHLCAGKGGAPRYQ
jgi:DNA-binding response OmpR family regulator